MCVDADGDGRLTYEEFMAFIRESEIKHNTAEMLPKIQVRSPKLTVALSHQSYILMTYRVVGTQGISVEEAVRMIKEKILSKVSFGRAASNLRKAFQAVDLDGSGTIEVHELQEVLRVKSSLDFDDGLMKR